MRAVFPRFLLVVALAAAALAGWVTASPAPSALAADRPVYFGGGFATSGIRPTGFGPNDSSRRTGKYFKDTYVNQVTWSSWGGATAIGSGMVSLNHLHDDQRTPVSVTLSGITNCGGFQIYTHYELMLPPGAPPAKDFSKVRSEDFPCHVNAGGYYPGVVKNPHCSYPGNEGCFMDGLSTSPLIRNWIPDVFEGGPNGFSTGHGPLKPRPRAWGGTDPSYLGMHWTAWSKPTVIGVGALNDLTHLWAVKVQLDGLNWCHERQITYTRMTITTYGKPYDELASGHGITTASVAMMRKRAGKGPKTNVVVQTPPAHLACHQP